MTTKQNKKHEPSDEWRPELPASFRVNLRTKAGKVRFHLGNVGGAWELEATPDSDQVLEQLKAWYSIAERAE